MSRRKYCTKDFIEAIPNSGGIISTIAARVQCNWSTADHWIKTKPTVAKAYADECESVGDLAESVIFTNIQLARKQQKDKKLADTSDAKWYLSRVRRGKYATRTEQDVTSGGEPLTFNVVYTNPPPEIPDDEN